MDALVVACPEDIVLEFLSVVDEYANHPLIVITVYHGLTFIIPEEGSLKERLAPIVEALFSSIMNRAEETSSQDVEQFDIVDRALAGVNKVWTHCPADRRLKQARVGWMIANMRPVDRIIHSVGVSNHVQFVPDFVRPLAIDLVDLKLDVIGQHIGPLVAFQDADRCITIEAIPAVEMFFQLHEGQANQLHAWLHSLDDKASLAVDPWDFEDSSYESERLEPVNDFRD